ncbi:hypothetical protein HUG20_17895 [Salicibibacter cibi]|uniref:Uncharacterized protein n=1 Tax=Salicibibacter cibi TaxID=2743001 RepID=A0A7T6ZDM8_9BACI|nr:hypothetical protein [Salicibibacter cibi]QQK81600.1 hypothetical protein HUG20_17895 [Salicibibacter cibi]
MKTHPVMKSNYEELDSQVSGNVCLLYGLKKLLVFFLLILSLPIYLFKRGFYAHFYTLLDNTETARRCGFLDCIKRENQRTRIKVNITGFMGRM